MKQVNRANGTVKFSLPDIIADPKDIHPQRKSRSQRNRKSQTKQAFNEEAEILSALEEDDTRVEKDFEVIDSFSLNLDPITAQAPRRSKAVSENAEEMIIGVALSPNEASVILIEQNGTYEWHYPAEAAVKSKSLKRGGPRITQEKTAVFHIPIGEGEPPKAPKGMRRTHRGPITSYIKGKVKGFIMKFIVRNVLGAISKRMEKGVKPGPVIITSSSDVTAWYHKDDFLSVKLPLDRPARVLLLVHGTFSSTLGSFGALTTHPSGQRFLELCLEYYDAILGYDHYTLADTPSDNAGDLFEDLLKLQTQSKGIEIDAISFSRGGLVYRYLTEQIVALEKTQLIFRNSIFVACTNAGTELANDENWKHLADIYTNLAVAASRLLALFPGTQLPAVILKQSVQVIGSLVKYIAQDAVVDNGIPGLSAMKPKGNFVLGINQVPKSRTQSGARFYYAIGSNFEPDGSTSAGELGKGLAFKVADGFVDKLMNEANDLVVDNDSMLVIDPVSSAKLLDSLPFGENGEIYHTVYFNQPIVARQCSEWLGLVQVKKNVAKVNTPRTWWKGAVSDNFKIFPGDANASDVLQEVTDEHSRFIVVERSYQDEVLRYGIPHSDLKDKITSKSNKNLDLIEMMDLQENQSTQISLDEALVEGSALDLTERSASLGGRFETVVIDEEGPVGVVAPPEALTSEELILEATAPVSRKKSSKKRRATRGRTAPKKQQETASHEQFFESAIEEPKPVWCYMHATMAEEAVIKKKALLEVTLSRDEIIRAAGVSAQSKGKVDKDKDIIVQVLARKHCVVSGESRLEVPVPAKGEEIPLFFDLIPKHAGVGEVDIIARQGNRPIVTLKLKPRFVAKASEDLVDSIVAQAEMTPLDNRLELKNVLYIDEGEMGSKQVLHFQFESETLKKRVRCSSEPFKNPEVRQKYISDLYNEIESFWAEDDVQYESFMDKLRARGVTIFKELLPKELQQVLWDAKDSLKAIQVYSSEPFIPWELAYLTEPGKKAKRDSSFLAEKGMVRWLAESNEYPPKKLRLRDKKFAYVIPKYPKGSRCELPGAQIEKKMLEDRYGAVPITPTSDKVLGAIETQGNLDILHFACHGTADSSSIWNAGLMMKGKINGNSYEEDTLLSSTVNAFADMKEENAPGPLVFLNACQVGRKGNSLTGTGGFVKAFINSGAGAFISTHWAIGDGQALEFSKAFYDKLTAGENIMKAVTAGRKAAKDKQEVTWLAYVVYADPYAKIEKNS